MNADMENVIENLEDLVNTLKLTNDMFDEDECESLLDKVRRIRDGRNSNTCSTETGTTVEIATCGGWYL